MAKGLVYQDCLGQPITLGDCVVWARGSKYSYLGLGFVTELKSGKAVERRDGRGGSIVAKIKVQCSNGSSTLTDKFSELVVVSDRTVESVRRDLVLKLRELETESHYG